MRHKRNSIRTTITAAFAGLVLLVTLLSAWTVTNIGSVTTLSGGVLQRELALEHELSGMRRALHEHHDAAMLLLGGHSDSARLQSVVAHETFSGHLGRALRTHRDHTIRPDLLRLQREYRAFSVHYELLAARAEEPPEELVGYYLGRIRPSYAELNSRLLHVRRTMFESSLVSLAEIDSQARLTIYATVAFSILLIGLGIYISYRTARALLRPIHQLTRSVRRIADGDYSQKIETQASLAELADLVGHFNVMSEQLRQHDALKLDRLLVEKRRSEAIVRDLPDAIVATDEEGRVIYFNRQAEDVLQISAKRAIGSLLVELRDVHPLLERMHGKLTPDSDGTVHDTAVVSAEGSEEVYEYSAQAIHNDGGGTIGHLFQIKDITSYRQVDRLRQKMISTVSHELRTPLTSIGLSLELLREEGTEENLNHLQRELLANLQDDVRRLQLFVDDLLDLSRIDDDGVRFDLRPVAPQALADAAVRQIAPLAARHEIQIDATRVDRALPRVTADPDRIAQVFANLFTNAIRYTPYRGRIQVAARVDADAVRFEVRDQGPGVAPRDAERIFDRFYQVRDDLRAGGSGLGLAIVKEIVLRHGGRVGVNSAVGAGSTFYFTLPVAPAAETARDLPASVHTAAQQP